MPDPEGPDNHYEPLKLAYYSAKFSRAAHTLVRAEMDKDGVRLDLVPELEALRPPRRGNARYLYIYLDGMIRPHRASQRAREP